MSGWAYLLELTRELRWVWPTTSSCSGLSLSFVLLSTLLACLVGCCLGAVLVLLAVSTTFRRCLQQVVLSVCTPAAPLVTVPAAPGLRRRLAEYRDSA